MRFFRRRSKSGAFSEPLLVARVAVEPAHALADALEPPAYMALASRLASAFAQAAKSADGDFLEWEPLSALCAWRGIRDRPKAVLSIAEALLTAGRQAVRVSNLELGEEDPQPHVRVAVDRGRCTAEIRGERMVAVLGPPVSRVHAMLARDPCQGMDRLLIGARAGGGLLGGAWEHIGEDVWATTRLA